MEAEPIHLSDFTVQRRGSTALSGLKSGDLSSRLDALIDSLPDVDQAVGDSLLPVGRVSSMNSESSSQSEGGDAPKMCTAHLEKAVTENMSIAKAMLTVAEYRGSFSIGVDMANVLTANGLTTTNTRALFKWIAKKAVQDPETPELLFREENVFTTFLSHLVLLEGRIFLVNTLRKVMKPMTSKKNEVEVDSNREPSEEVRKQNMKTLVSIIESTFKLIFEGVSRLSTTIRCALRMVHYAVNKRFGPEAAIQAVGGVFFLRFFCPNLVTPEQYGILRDVSGAQRRKLILLSKFVQLVANKTHSTGTQWIDEVLDKVCTKKFEKKMDAFYETLMNGGRRSSSYLETMPKVDKYINSSARKVTRFALREQGLLQQNTQERCSHEWDGLSEERRQAIIRREEVKRKRKASKKEAPVNDQKPIVHIPVTNLENAIAGVLKCKRNCQPRHYRRIHALGSETNFASG